MKSKISVIKFSEETIFSIKCSIAFFILIHGYFFTNHLGNADDVLAGVHHKAGKWEISLGRWGYWLINQIIPEITMPWVCGIISMAALVVTGILIVDLFKFKSKRYIVLSSLLLLAYPSIMVVFGYLFCSYQYMISLMMAVSSVWAILRIPGLKKYIVAGFILALSMSIYQSYLGIAVSICMVKLVAMIADESIGIKDVAKQLIDFIIYGIVAIAIYYTMLQASLYIAGISLSSYRGMNDINLIKLFTDMPKAIGEIYIFIYNVLFGYNIWYNSMVLIISRIVLLFIILAYIIRIKNNYRKLLYIIGIALMPITFGIMKFISADIFLSPTIITQSVFFFILPLVLMNGIQTKTWKAIKHICVTMVLINGIVFAYIDNVGYFNLELSYQKGYSRMIEITNEIEKTQSYYPNIPVLIVGNWHGDNYDITNQNEQKYLKGMELLEHDLSIYDNNTHAFASFSKDYLGLTFDSWSGEGKRMEIINTEEFQAMPNYPREGSINTIRGVVVVKLNY